MVDASFMQTLWNMNPISSGCELAEGRVRVRVWVWVSPLDTLKTSHRAVQNMFEVLAGKNKVHLYEILRALRVSRKHQSSIADIQFKVSSEMEPRNLKLDPAFTSSLPASSGRSSSWCHLKHVL